MFLVFKFVTGNIIEVSAAHSVRLYERTETTWVV